MPILPWAEPRRLLALFESDDAVRTFVNHNAHHLRLVHGGHALATENRLSFDPREEYWRRPGRRAAVWYLSTRGQGAFAPVDAMRAIALDVCRALDRVTDEEPFADVDHYVPRWGTLVERIVAERLPALATSAAWDRWRAARGGAPAATLRDDVAAFLATTVQEGRWGEGEPSGRFRIPWFPYLGADAAALERRRAFFFGWANLFCSTNAYRFSGAQIFAPLLQNNPTDLLLGYVDRWFAGEDPRTVGFHCVGSRDDVPADRVSYATVSELWGLVAFRRVPYVNNINMGHFRELIRSLGLPDPGPKEPYSLAKSLGDAGRKLLTADPGLRDRCAAVLDAALATPLAEPIVSFETVSSARLATQLGQKPEDLVDARLLARVDAHAKAAFSTWTAQERASAAFHLLLDAVINAGRLDDTPIHVRSGSPTASGGAAVPSLDAEGERVRLPPPLVPIAQLALAYLNAGLHVLLAGAPGTGKTQIAQFVAAAWNQGSDTIPREMRLADAPPTVVANSAWSPFHTIGGLVPDEDQRFVATPGVFVARPQPGQRVWSLHHGAIVLDEMNRADLDRSIGDLYPMLSGTVREVRPAGLPGVDAITLPPRFRIIATVNDATIDDVVFPMSQGLARRFVRIELPGASRDDVATFLEEQAGGAGARLSAAREAVEGLFEAAKLESRFLSDGDRRLPFGAGWFALLGRWAAGRFVFPQGESEASDVADARRALVATLRSAVCHPALSRILARVESGEGA